MKTQMMKLILGFAILSTCTDTFAKTDSNSSLAPKPAAGNDQTAEAGAADCVPCHTHVKDGLLTDPSPDAKMQQVDAAVGGAKTDTPTKSDATF